MNKCLFRFAGKVHEWMFVCMNLCSGYCFRSTRLMQRIWWSIIKSIHPTLWLPELQICSQLSLQPPELILEIFLSYSVCVTSGAFFLGDFFCWLFFWGWKSCLNWCLKRKEGKWVCRYCWGKSAVVNQTTVNMLGLVTSRMVIGPLIQL